VLGVIVTAGKESWSKGAEEICKLLLLEDVFGWQTAEIVKGPIVSATETVVAWRKSEQ
jgi:hypothetical protein